MIRQSKIENPKSKIASDFAECAGTGGQGDAVTVVSGQWSVVRKDIG
jgi:hypothetical protein